MHESTLNFIEYELQAIARPGVKDTHTRILPLTKHRHAEWSVAE